MRKFFLIIFGVCFWITLLAAIVTTVARVSAEAKERRNNAIASHLSKIKR